VCRGGEWVDGGWGGGDCGDEGSCVGRGCGGLSSCDLGRRWDVVDDKADRALKRRCTITDIRILAPVRVSKC
jgi:hypothetical protein